MIPHNVFLSNYYKLSWKRDKKAREAKKNRKSSAIYFRIYWMI